VTDLTPSQREARFSALRELGCIACRLEKAPILCGVTEIHHLTIGGYAGQKRRGDLETIPLGRWHHQGIPKVGRTSAHMEELYGPSYRFTSREFRKSYGSDDQLLARVNELIGASREVFFPPNNPPPRLKR
jgi:hypothetical protein